jgi:hypothetical protein
MHASLFDIKGRLRFTDVPVADLVTDWSGIVLLSLMGAPQANRAIWANIVKRRTTRNPTKTQVSVRRGGEEFRLEVTPKHKYHMASGPRGEGIVIVRADLNRMNYRYILGGDEETPSPWFQRALTHVPTMPYREEWLPAIWQKAMKTSAITRPDRMWTATSIWKINRNERLWHTIIKELLQEGVIA